MAERLDHLEWYRLRYWEYVKGLRRVDFYKPYLRRFHFDFINNPRLNAFAAVADRVFLVGFNQGTLLNIETFFSLLLSHPKVLPHIGNPEREVLWFKSLANCPWHDTLAKIYAAADTESVPPAMFPVDPDRKLAAVRLTILAMDFLFYHEIGHLANGHMELIDDDELPIVLAEAAGGLRATLDPLDSQALELNADTHAAATIVGECFALPEVFPESYSFSDLTEFVESFVLAVIAIFMMFDAFPRGLSQYRGASHPHPAVRLTNVYMSVCRLAQRSSPKWLDRIQTAWANGLAMSEQMCRSVQIGSALWYAAGHQGRQVIKTYDEIVHRFQAIDRKLRPDLNRW